MNVGPGRQPTFGPLLTLIPPAAATTNNSAVEGVGGGRVYICVLLCVWRSEVNSGCLPLLISILYFVPLAFVTEPEVGYLGKADVSASPREPLILYHQPTSALG